MLAEHATKISGYKLRAHTGVALFATGLSPDGCELRAIRSRQKIQAKEDKDSLGCVGAGRVISCWRAKQTKTVTDYEEGCSCANPLCYSYAPNRHPEWKTNTKLALFWHLPPGGGRTLYRALVTIR